MVKPIFYWNIFSLIQLYEWITNTWNNTATDGSLQRDHWPYFKGVSRFHNIITYSKHILYWDHNKKVNDVYQHLEHNS